VNHEPLTRFAEGSPPLQLAVDNLALGSDPRVPLEARLPLGTASKAPSVPVIVPMPAPAAEPAEAETTPAANPVIQEPAAAEATADQSKAASLAVAAESPEPPGAAAERIALAPTRQEATSVGQDQQPTEPAATTPATGQTAAMATAADDQQPTAKATTPGAELTAAIATTPDDQQATSKATNPEEKATAKPTRASRPAAQARRPVKIVHIRRTVATTAAQPSYQYSQSASSQSAYWQSVYSQPAYKQSTYGWANGTAQASQTKRVVAKRHRAPPKPAPAVQSAPAADTAGLSNSQ
jgi:hypothetical protein